MKIHWYGMCLLGCVTLLGEDIFVKPKKVKTESAAKVKEQLLEKAQELVKLSTKAVRQITHQVDSLADDIKQLVGGQDGKLANADVAALKAYGQKMQTIEQALQQVLCELS